MMGVPGVTFAAALASTASSLKRTLPLTFSVSAKRIGFERRNERTTMPQPRYLLMRVFTPRSARLSCR